MRHKVRDLGVFFCLAVMLFTVTSCGKEVSDQTIAATEQSSEERRDAEAVMGTETVETFSTEKAGWFCMQTLWRRRKIVCELCGGSHGKPCSICHGKGVITDDCILCHGAKKCTVCGGSGKM